MDVLYIPTSISVFVVMQSSGVDYCAKGHACHANATCLNLQTTYACHCNHGFHGDGHKCTGTFFSNLFVITFS